MWRLRNLECWLCEGQLIALQGHLNLLVFVSGVPALLLDTRDRPKWSCLVQTAKCNRPHRACLLIDERCF